MRLVRRLALALPLTILLAPATAGADTITFTLPTEFSGGAQPSGSPTATLTDVGINQVQLTIVSNLSGTEKLTDFYLNYTGDLSTLLFAPTGGDTGSFATANVGPADSYKADGDGYFDIRLDFNTSGNVFGAGESIVFLLTGTGLMADLFNAMSFCSTGCGNGSYFAAAHVQSIGANGDSGWVGDGNGSDNETPNPVPEPSSLLLLGSALAFGARRLRRRAVTA